jgi:hypothetical protein
MRRDPTGFPGRYAAQQKQLEREAADIAEYSNNVLGGIADEEECKICGLPHPTVDCPRRTAQPAEPAKPEPPEALLSRERKAQAFVLVLLTKRIRSDSVEQLTPAYWTEVVDEANKRRPEGSPRMHSPSPTTKALIAEKLRDLEKTAREL